MSGAVVVRQAATGEICAGACKSALCSASVPSVGGFDRTFLATEHQLPLLNAIKGAIIAATCWNRANVG
jgi:hypothetical protein